ncbi:MAG: helix-turn-helix transcriptional regulator [Clostridia bacterium]|nr:helix-turn-helix transcriptional regulator [Clostridia bacterium]
MVKFSEILNELIDDKGLSLRKLARESGVTSSQLSKYLKGLMPTIEIAVRLANYFEVTLDFLFGVESENFFVEPIELDLDNFVNKYEKLLAEAKTSHYKIAKKTTLSESSLRRWRKGHVPSMDAFVIIADALSTSIDFLVGKVSDKISKCKFATI